MTTLHTTPTAHVRLDGRGVAWIDDTGYRVTDVAIDHTFHGFAPREICANHYDRLTLAQVFAALSYYYDHKDQLDTQIAREEQEVEALLQKAAKPIDVERLLKIRQQQAASG